MDDVIEKLEAIESEMARIRSDLDTINRNIERINEYNRKWINQSTQRIIDAIKATKG